MKSLTAGEERMLREFAESRGLVYKQGPGLAEGMMDVDILSALRELFLATVERCEAVPNHVWNPPYTSRREVEIYSRGVSDEWKQSRQAIEEHDFSDLFDKRGSDK